jgi:hypothetical protein
VNEYVALAPTMEVACADAPARLVPDTVFQPVEYVIAPPVSGVDWRVRTGPLPTSRRSRLVYRASPEAIAVARRGAPGSATPP